MQYSIVNLSEVRQNSDFRIDAECYYAHNKGIETKIKNINHIHFIDIIKKFNSGKNLKQENFGNNFVRTQNIQNIIINNNVSYTNEKIDLLEYGDLIFTRVGEGVGNNSITTRNFINSAYSDNVIRIKIDTLNPFFVSTFFNIEKVKKYFKKFFKGTARPLISKENFSKILVPLFSNYFQDYIEKLICVANDKEQSADNLYKEAENILLEELDLKDYKPQNKKCFIKNLSDTKKAGRFDAEYFQPKYEDVIEKIKGYKGGYKTLEYFINNYSTGYPYKSEEYQNSGIPVIRIANIGKNKLELENNPTFISEEYSNISIKDIAKAGNILISMSGTIGNVAEIPENMRKCCINQRVLSFESKNINNKYLVLFLNSFFGYIQFERIGVGGLQINLSYNDIKNLLIPLLPPSIQSSISSKIQSSFSAREKSKQLLEVAKRAVEIAIEEDEESGLKYIEENK